ncbi:MAG: tetratricopeptide repeat protein [Anaerolineales bacterium]|nr:tetratricopeptide repeat protein [Anaerolineales bacterium]
MSLDLNDGASDAVTPASIHILTPRFILEQHGRGEFSGELRAATLFVDISGFSAMVDTLMAHGQHGAEVAADIMRAVLEPVIDTVFSYRGFVSNQAGDAVTAIFPADQGGDDRAALQAALAAAARIQTIRKSHTDHESPYGSFAIGVKIGLAAGPVEWGIVRSTDDRRAMYYFRGPAIDACAEAEHQAKAGDIVLAPGVEERAREFATVDVSGGAARVVAVADDLPAPIVPQLPPPDLDLMARYFPLSVLTQEYSGEFRWVVNVFVALPTVRTTVQLHTFMQTVFELQGRYGGFVNRLDFGDKGANLLIFWGAPVAHENDIQRALEFLLDLQTRTSIPVSAGVSYRISHAGAMGGSLAEEYTCYGRGVNLAARLMQTSSPGDILVDEDVAQRAEQHFDLEFLGEQSFKGFADKQRVYQLFDRREDHDELFRWPMAGRQRELHQLEEFLAPLATGTCAGAVIVLGEAGTGKSHLIHAVQHSPAVEAIGARWALCQANQTLSESLHPFRYWLMDFFGQSSTQVEARNKLAFNRRLNTLVADCPDSDLSHELDRTRSFIGALLGLRWPDSLYEEMDAQGRFENTMEGLIALIKAESLRQPIILHVEDAQWLDADSLTLMERLWRRIDDQPVAMVATARSEQFAASIRDALLALITCLPWIQIDLGRLSTDDLTDLASHILGAPVAPSLAALLQARTEGNPLFAQQFVLYLKEQQLLQQNADGAFTAASLAGQDVPADVQALLIARIDTLTNEIRNIVHTASVLGREFEVLLLSDMLTNAKSIARWIAIAEKADIWQPMSEIRYIFMHGLLRDTAYRMLTHQRRSALHRLAAEASERQFAADLAPHYSSIGFHYEQADMAAPACRYLQLAGQAAADSYQNQVAIDLLTRALALAEAPSQRLDLLLARETVFDRLGQRDDQRDDLDKATQLAEQLGEPQRQATVALRLANLLRVVGKLQDSLEALEQAVDFSRRADDRTGEARVWLLRGMIAFRNGDYDLASQHLTTSYTLASESGASTTAAEAHYNLGNCALANEDLDEARRHYTEALEVFQETHQHRGEVNCLLMTGVVDRRLGNLDVAVETYQRALVTAREIGWRHGESYVLSSLGNTWFILGDFGQAAEKHLEALVIRRNVADRQGEAASLDTLGLVAQFQSDADHAHQQYEEALAMQRSQNDQRSQAYTLTHIALLTEETGDLDAAASAQREALALRTRGSSLISAAIDNLAGLARIALARSDMSEARQRVGQIADLLAEKGMADVEFPALVYLTMYRVLRAAGETERAEAALVEGQAMIRAQAGQIADAAVRQMFLDHGPYIHQLLSA